MLLLMTILGALCLESRDVESEHHDQTVICCAVVPVFIHARRRHHSERGLLQIEIVARWNE